jgi:hypothetical protein
MEIKKEWPITLNPEGDVTITYELFMVISRMLGYVNGATNKNGEPYPGYFDELKKVAEPLKNVIGEIKIKMKND